MTMDVNQKAGFTKPESAASAMPNVDVDSTAHNEAEVLVTAHAQRRKRRIFAAGGTALVGKGMMLISNAAIVPLTVRYLGAEQFGLWITITSTMTMLIVLDLGIANTLTNLISEAYAKEDRTLAGHYFATAFWMVSGLAVALGLAGFLAGGRIEWGGLFHVSAAGVGPALTRSLAVAFGVFLLGLPMGLAQRILAGYQELHAANVISGGGAILSLGLVAVGVSMKETLPWLVAGFAAGPVLANLGSLAWICLHHKPWMMPWPSRVRRMHLGAIFHSGSRFFLIQLAGVIVFNSDNLVISHYLDPAHVTPYSVTWRLASYGSSLQALLSPALWPAYAEAYARSDMKWIRTTYLRMQRGTVALLMVVALGLFLGGKWIIHLWAGQAAVPSTLLLGLGVPGNLYQRDC